MFSLKRILSSDEVFSSPLPKGWGKVRWLGRGGGHFLSLLDAFISTLGIGIGIGLNHVYNQDSWYWSWIISNIKTSLGIGLDRYEKSRHLLVLVSKKNPFQDLSWYWSWMKIEIQTSFGLGLEQNKWSCRTLSSSLTTLTKLNLSLAQLSLRILTLLKAKTYHKWKVLRFEYK